MEIKQIIIIKKVDKVNTDSVAPVDIYENGILIAAGKFKQVSPTEILDLIENDYEGAQVTVIAKASKDEIKALNEKHSGSTKNKWMFK